MLLVQEKPPNYEVPQIINLRCDCTIQNGRVTSCGKKKEHRRPTSFWRALGHCQNFFQKMLRKKIQKRTSQKKSRFQTPIFSWTKKAIQGAAATRFSSNSWPCNLAFNGAYFPHNRKGPEPNMLPLQSFLKSNGVMFAAHDFLGSKDNQNLSSEVSARKPDRLILKPEKSLQGQWHDTGLCRTSKPVTAFTRST